MMKRPAAAMASHDVAAVKKVRPTFETHKIHRTVDAAIALQEMARSMGTPLDASHQGKPASVVRVATVGFAVEPMSSLPTACGGFEHVASFRPSALSSFLTQSRSVKHVYTDLDEPLCARHNKSCPVPAADVLMVQCKTATVDFCKSVVGPLVA